MNKEQKYYFTNGKLNLSLLNEEVTKDCENKQTNILEEIESIKVSNQDISSTLEEVALMFKEEEIKDLD